MRVPRPQPWALGLLLFLLPGSLGAETPAKSSVPVVGIIIGVLLLTAAAVGGALLWRRMRSGLPAPWISLRGDDTGSLLPTPGEAQDADSKDINVIPATA
uniref:Fc gamma receptor and transporter n=1 Tax=Piliocolobus tephrosceles TaxID=591936 RepID=A0A8C9J323_9PRIM